MVRSVKQADDVTEKVVQSNKTRNTCHYSPKTDVKQVESKNKGKYVYIWPSKQASRAVQADPLHAR